MFPRQSDGIGTTIIKILFFVSVVSFTLFVTAFVALNMYCHGLTEDAKKSLADFQEPLPSGFKFSGGGVPGEISTTTSVLACYEPTGMTFEVSTYRRPDPTLSTPGEHKGNNELSDQQYATWLKEINKMDIADVSASKELTAAGQTMRCISGNQYGKRVVVGFLPQDFVVARSASEEFDFVVFKKFLDSIRALKTDYRPR
jgi:hypothetical protein